MKIYFAGSIRGGRADAELYSRLISRMKERGHAVLTEHIGKGSIKEMGEENMTDAEIYRQDISWLGLSDVVIAECSTPSLGVGYELCYAERLGIPAHIFYNSGRGTLSAMLTGDSYYIIHCYTSEAELFAQLDAILQKGD